MIAIFTQLYFSYEACTTSRTHEWNHKDCLPLHLNWFLSSERIYVPDVRDDKSSNNIIKINLHITSCHGIVSKLPLQPLNWRWEYLRILHVQWFRRVAIFQKKACWILQLQFLFHLKYSIPCKKIFATIIMFHMWWQTKVNTYCLIPWCIFTRQSLGVSSYKVFKSCSTKWLRF